MKPRVVKIAALLAVVLAVVARSAQPEALPDRAALRKQFDAGNFRDAYDGLGRLALDPRDDPALVGADLGLAIDALIQLGGTYELDELTEAAISVHSKNWRLLWAAAADYQRFDHRGYMIAGKFSRGLQPQAGQAVSALERDRVRALQLMVAAMPLAAADSNRGDVANFYLELANMLLAGRGYEQAWRLQSLSDLRQLPDYEPGFYTPEPPAGAAVDADGQPVFFTVPKRWQDAADDGQRWRWALAQAAAFAPDKLNEVRWQLGQFCESQFGVQTMADYGPFFAAQAPEETVAAKEPAKPADANPKPAASGAFALQTLADDETIARLATGICRFKLPDEFNFIKIYQQIADEPKTGRGADALDQLARIFENRRQYARAADFWRRGIKEYGPGESKARQASLQQIVGNWGVFESRLSQPAGKGATVDFRYRNAHSVHFEAQQIKVQALLADIKVYLKTNPRQLDPNRLDLGNIGFQLVDQNQKQYLGATVAAWDLELKPIAGHFDRRLTVATPLQQAGAYLLTAKLADGNTSRIIVWLEDTAIVRKPLADGMFYYVADAASGQPIAKANLEFFGYRQKQIGDGPQSTIDTLNFAEQTDADGQLIRAPKPDEPQYSWLITATAPESRLAYLGFTNVWYPQYADPAYDEVKVFTITDRPVYRPGQKVKFKFWIRHARYDQPDTSDFANQSFTVEIRDPKGAKIVSKAMTADAYGGLDGDFALPDDSTLGVWQLQIAGKGGGSFRVEEYKKPELEVTVDAPNEPIRLGEKIKATVKAKYYFGSPVTDARVKYKVLRTSYSEHWLPPDPWDWLYGRGYWWFAYDCPWYPGWSHWGTARPPGWWWPVAQEQPEVVAERTAAIGPDGTLTVEIDTAVAAMIHPDQDHQYQIVVEVTDPSRRTIVGEGTVLVARKPFQVSAWVDRGYYRVGDVIRAEFHAQTLAGRPVRGDGQLTLFKVAYKDGKPAETQVRTWALATDEQGSANLQIKASEPGQYRLAFRLTDEKKQTEEAGYLLTVVGDGFDGSDFRFNDVELIPDQRQYAPKQTVNLMVNTNRSGAAVLLFVRPSGSVYLKPKLLRLKGKSTVEEIPVVLKDMPNFFVEAVTIGDGRLFSELKEIVVPPEQRVLNVTVQPSRTTYKPTQKATVAIKLTDMLGKPFVGSTVVSIYDKAVEYISGGSNVPKIKAFFWQWRRNHQMVTETNLEREFDNLLRENEIGMQDLGLFGN